MQLPESVQRNTGTIAGFELSIPAPYTEAHVLSAAEAAILNQTFKENISNNLRKKLEAGRVLTEGAEATPHDDASAQELVDAYVAEYEPGQRRGGGDGSTTRTTDPAEREARKIARAKAEAWVKTQGTSKKEIAKEGFAEIVEKLFENNREMLMREGAKIVKAQQAASSKTDELSFDGIGEAA